MPTLEFQAIVNSLQSAIFTPGNLVTVSAVTTQANIPVLDLTVNQIDTDSFTIDTSTTPPTLRITAHPEQSPWHSPIDAAGFYLYDLQYLQFADGSVQTTAFNAGAVGQTPWLSDIDAAGLDLINLASVEFGDSSIQNTAFPGIAAVQTPWLQPINAQGFNLMGFGYLIGGGVELRPLSSQFPLTVRNSANTAWNWYIDTGGELVTDTARTISKIGAVSFSDGTIQNTAYKGIAVNQTPWISNINAAGFSLSNVSNLTVNGLITNSNQTIQPLNASNPWLVHNVAGLIDWGIDVNGHLASDTNRSLARVGAFSFSTTGAGTLTFKDGTVQTTAFTAGAGVQTPWQTNIDAASHALSFLSALNMLSGGPITNVGTLTFVNATIQNTAFPGIGATQTPWLQDINGNGKVLSNSGLITPQHVRVYAPGEIWHLTADQSAINFRVDTTGGVSAASLLVTAGSQFNNGIIIKTAGQYPLLIRDAADTSYDWVVDLQGHLSSQTSRNITTGGTIYGNDIYAAAGLVGGSSGIYVKAGAGPTILLIDASTNFLSSVSGTSQIAMSATGGGLKVGSNMSIRFSSTLPWDGPQDLQLMRATAGILRIWNPAAGELGELQCLTVVSPNVHQAARYDIYGGPQGVSGTYTTANGKTVTVTGGIITNIV